VLLVSLPASHISFYHLSHNTVQISVPHRKEFIASRQRLLKLPEQFIDEI
jgi:hypothetical protein